MKEYSIFVSKVRKYIGEVLNKNKKERKSIIRNAVNKAIDECINEDVLKDFFLQYRKEVMEVGVLGYSAKRHIQVISEERYDTGFSDAQKEYEVLLADKDKTIADKDKEIAALRAELDKLNSKQ